MLAFNVNATRNWWGASNGPGPVAAGSGDKVTTNVTYAPWLRSPSGASCGEGGDNEGNGNNNNDNGNNNGNNNGNGNN